MRILAKFEEKGEVKEIVKDYEDYGDLRGEKQVKILVPAQRIGLIIGRNGRNIRRLKKQGFKIKIDDELKRGSQEKVMAVTRESENGDMEALLKEISKIVGKPTGYALYDPGEVQDREEADDTVTALQSMILSLEKRLVGAVIGKEGCTIKSLREEFRVKIHVKPARRERRDVVIYGSQSDMQQLKQRIIEICEEEKQRLDELQVAEKIGEGNEEEMSEKIGKISLEE